MADKTISQLSSASTPLAGTEVLPIVQSNATVKVAANDLTVKNIRSNATTGILQVAGPSAAATRVMTVPDANFTAARTDAAQSFSGDQTFGNGNVVIGTASKGIDFSANSSAAGMTSELLNDYEEGTWTPTVTDGTANVPMSAGAGWYVKVGNIVTIGWNSYALDVSSLDANLQVRIKSIPFTAAAKDAWSAANFSYDNSGKNYVQQIAANQTEIYLYVTSGSSADFAICTKTTLGGNTVSFFGTATYYSA
jgi:hypothetical protein